MRAHVSLRVVCGVAGRRSCLSPTASPSFDRPEFRLRVGAKGLGLGDIPEPTLAAKPMFYDPAQAVADRGATSNIVPAFLVAPSFGRGSDSSHIGLLPYETQRALHFAEIKTTHTEAIPESAATWRALGALFYALMGRVSPPSVSACVGSACMFLRAGTLAGLVDEGGEGRDDGG